MSNDLLASAASFAAHAHIGQLRKDGRTPYFAHPVRVCLSLTTVFNVNDVELLAGALLHDTIEDSTTDYDDLKAEFGAGVADLVRALTKDKRLPEDERERQYVGQINGGGWRVQILKLADIYDNLADAATIPTQKRQASIARAKFYLAAMEPALAPESRDAFAIVKQRLLSVEKKLQST